MGYFERHIPGGPSEGRDFLLPPKAPDLSKGASSQTLIQYQKELLQFYEDNGRPESDPSVIECHEKLAELEFVQSSTVHPVIITNTDSSTLGFVMPTSSPCIFMNAKHFQSFNKDPDNARIREPLSARIRQQHIHVLEHEGQHLSHHRNWSIRNELPGWDKLTPEHRSLICQAIGVSSLSLRDLMEGMTENMTIEKEGVLKGVYPAQVQAWRRFDALVKNRTGTSLTDTFANKTSDGSYERFESAVIDIANQLLLQKTAFDATGEQLTDLQIENIKIISHTSSRSGVVILDKEAALIKLNKTPIPLSQVLYRTRNTLDILSVPHGRGISLSGPQNDVHVNFFGNIIPPEDVKMLQGSIVQRANDVVLKN